MSFPINVQVNLTMDLCLLAYCVVVTFLLLLFAFFDVNYFLRVAVTVLWGRWFEGKKKADETTEIYSICTTTDLDIMFKHMNNARFVRELDFARFHFYDRTGIYRIITKAKAHALQTATNIRYRRTIPLFTPYKLTTKIVYWEDKMLYLEQQFVTLDGFVRAVVLSKQNAVGLNFDEIMPELLGKDKSYRPELSPELEAWISSMDKSSARLRKKEE